MKWPWQWTAAEYRAFGDWYLGAVCNRLTFKIAAGLIIGVTSTMLLLGQCNSDPPPLCDTFVYYCITRG